MLTRRHLRIKVMQAIYAHHSIGDEPIEKREKKMLRSFDQLYNLVFYQLSFLIEIFDFAKEKVDEGKNKLLPSQEDLEPNTKFINNRVIEKLRHNRDYVDNFNRLRINWSEHKEVIRKLYWAIREHKIYRDYMTNSQSSFQEDRALVVNIVKEFISDYTSLKNIYEEESIFWDEDYYAANQMLINIIEGMSPEDDELKKLPHIFKDYDENGKSEDKQFAVDLFRKTLLQSNNYEDMITTKAQNWEFDRIAKVDLILLKMAIAELLEFPAIPVKVTMNEYIEVSKYYSTPKSRIFINGILDNLIAEMQADGKIKKTGRGLISS